MLEDLRTLTKEVNKFAFEWCGHRSTCILSSAALVYVLRALDYEAFPVRVRCSVHSLDNHRKAGVVLGSDGDGARLPSAGRDMWHGHLVVVAENRFLLDPTIDQAGYGGNKHSQWIRLLPLALEISDRFIRGEEGFSSPWGNAGVYYSVRQKQTGFFSAPDWRYKSHWMPVAQKVLDVTKVVAKQSRVA